MARRRFFVPGGLIHGATATLPPEQAHHLRDVLRLTTGDEVELFDGTGAGYSGKVELAGAEVRVRDIEVITAKEKSSPSLILAAALIKSDRFECILQKATELGVDEFLPLVTRFCKVRVPEDRLEARMDRWQRIVREASKQCRRVDVPRIQKPVPFSDFLALGQLGNWTALMLYEKASNRLRIEAPPKGRIVLCIGPEGGWAQTEAEAAARAGCCLFGLGARILRAETAALAAIAIVQHQLADLDVGPESFEKSGDFHS